MNFRTLSNKNARIYRLYVYIYSLLKKKKKNGFIFLQTTETRWWTFHQRIQQTPRTTFSQRIPGILTCQACQVNIFSLIYYTRAHLIHSIVQKLDLYIDLVGDSPCKLIQALPVTTMTRMQLRKLTNGLPVCVSHSGIFNYENKYLSRQNYSVGYWINRTNICSFGIIAYSTIFN